MWYNVIFISWFIDLFMWVVNANQNRNVQWGYFSLKIWNIFMILLIRIFILLLFITFSVFTCASLFVSFSFEITKFVARAEFTKFKKIRINLRQNVRLSECLIMTCFTMNLALKWRPHSQVNFMLETFDSWYLW